jgi:hypothetical protein
MTSSIATSRATALAVVSLSPVNSTGRRPSSLSRATATALVSFTVSATTRTAFGSRSQPAAIAVWPRDSAPPGGLEPRLKMHGPVGQQRRTSGDHPVPVDDALDAEPFTVDEPVDRGQLAVLCLGRGGDRLGDGMLGGVL